MLRPGFYDYVCKSPADIPAAAFGRLRREVARALGKRLRDIFPRFAGAFPRTMAAMEEHWPKPVVVLKELMGDWITALVLIRSDLNLYFKLKVASDDVDGPEFERGHNMLPHRWRELYRCFDSFVISERAVMPMQWANTPFPYAGRLWIHEYARLVGGKGVRKVFKSAPRLTCWLMTDDGNALFLDEERCDHTVYHVRGRELSAIVPLANGESILDDYLAHVVSGRLMREYDFRAA